MLAGGIAAAGLQCLYIREYLTVFHGNELVLGLILGLWLTCSGAGSTWGRSRSLRHIQVLIALIVAGAVWGMVSIRAARLVFGPGEMLSPVHITAIIVATQGPAAFFCGHLFGCLSLSTTRRALYGCENAGNILGSLLVFGGVLLFIPNGVCAVCVCIPLILVIYRRNVLMSIGLLLLVTLVMIDGPSLGWKYRSDPHRIQNGRYGEIAFIAQDGDTTVMLNNHIYRSSIVLPAIEQSVHIPLALHPAPRNALVIHDRHYGRELKKYTGLHYDCVEPEPLLADTHTQGARLNDLPATRRYDAILLGTDIPYNVESNRYYTYAFFRHLHTRLRDSAVVAFTLSFNTNYMSGPARDLFSTIHTTLDSAFEDVYIFPGNGYTFVGATFTLDDSFAVRVPTRYLADYTLASVTRDELQRANTAPASDRINTVNKPYALTLALQRWTSHFTTSLWFLVILAAVILGTGIFVLPTNRTILSIGTSGFTTGAYSVALLLLYQSYHGNLYSYVALLMTALTAGFVLGSRIRTLPAADLLFALYTAASFVLLVSWRFPPVWLFFILQTGIGTLSAAQFVSLQRTKTHLCYAADLFGGIFGMSLCSVVFVPYLGIIHCALWLAALKGTVWLVTVLTGRPPLSSPHRNE
jgi:hypothetical protein